MNTYEQKAHATRSRRNYPSKAQILAGRKLISQGCNALNRTELELLATHPDMSSAQKSEWKAMAERA